MNTIRTYLVAMVVATFTLFSFLAALNGYQSSIEETQRLMDTQLENISAILLLNNGTLQQELPASSFDTNLSFQLWQGETLITRSSLAPETIIKPLEEGFNYANFSGYRWRTLIKKGDGYRWAVVAERSDLRYILAEKVALESVTPLFLWLPLSAILVWLLVGIGMRPLRELSQQINLKRSDNLNPIIYDNPPQELVQLIDSTNSLLARLNASFEREKHFSSHAAHELRTPLSVIKVHLHNLAEDLAKDHQGLAHANAGIDRMHRLIEQILDLNRTHPDIIEANFKAIDLHKLVKQVTASAWPQFSARNQSLSLNGETVFIMGDEYMLETLLENLLNNANKYTPIDGEIEVSVTRTNGKARLQVADSGLGIPVEKRNHVFERFYRANSEKNSEATGSGLGLAIVKHIAQLHDATINLNHSRFPSGLLITIDFPLNEESPQ